MIQKLSAALLILTVALPVSRAHAQNQTDAAALRPGFIQVKCGPGATVFLDGERVGVTTEELGGMVIENVPVGTHVVTCVKKGFRPQQTRVTVAPGTVQLARFKPFVERAPVTDTARDTDAAIGQHTGTLVIRTVPVDCHLQIEELDLVCRFKRSDVVRVF